MTEPGRDGSPAMLDGYVRLASAILIQALLDTQSKDWADRLDSVLWLAGPEAQEIGELVGVTDVFGAYVSGNCKIPVRGSEKRRGWGWRVK